MVEKNDERQNKVKEAKNDKAGRSVGPPIKKRLGKMGLGEMRRRNATQPKRPGSRNCNP